ncbi:mechanosensitive ion channel family protein [Marinobacter sp. LV10MA510-1]|uniref:mechanosensitive ion channel family protein n=1 Tax=Marinobacter sp. LV10MA510-1 TaxID=1415567 RepID=UPI000C00D696|nr:mechanosensitive ion channel domain-containing protein [Marinobacter sp. LV10MA510-1]PFG09607.1 mechanosensitive ion channel-like protein [Marinobacter sp. LV10MA510-1]
MAKHKPEQGGGDNGNGSSGNDNPVLPGGLIPIEQWTRAEASVRRTLMGGLTHWVDQLGATISRREEPFESLDSILELSDEQLHRIAPGPDRKEHAQAVVDAIRTLRERGQQQPLDKPWVISELAAFWCRHRSGLALGFAFKDYANSLIAGIVTLYEMPYRPGDWIEINGQYGEVRAIGTRAAELLTPDDTVIVVPHSKLWDSLIANGNDGTNHLMCVAEFHLQPHHDMARAMTLLRTVAFTHPLTKTWKPVLVVVSNKPWGMVYRLKAYPVEPSAKFRFISELTATGAQVMAAEGIGFVSALMTGN